MSRLFSGTPFEEPIKCDTCGKYTAECRCIKSDLPAKKRMSEQPGGKNAPRPAGYQLTPQNADPPKDQLIKISTEKRKGGRIITVIKGLEHPANDLPELCTQLKTTLGTGGSVQGRTIEIQGDHTDPVKRFFDARHQKARIL